jgi:hypothetical protein
VCLQVTFYWSYMKEKKNPEEWTILVRLLRDVIALLLKSLLFISLYVWLSIILCVLNCISNRLMLNIARHNSSLKTVWSSKSFFPRFIVLRFSSALVVSLNFPWSIFTFTPMNTTSGRDFQTSFTLVETDVFFLAFLYLLSLLASSLELAVASCTKCHPQNMASLY